MAEPRDRLDGYELLRLLGAGGMGEVWLARDAGLGRKVALKLLPQGFTHDERRVARFEQEARAASTLSHPNICHVYALGQTADGQRYIAMELVEGATLRDRLQANHLPLSDALKIADQIAGAVSAAHAAGIVHRDLKPENVIIRPDGLVKVLDFGLAKLASPAIEAANTESTRTALHTDAGTIVGTIAYMSPEQTRGSEVDARTDIWSLGVMLYEMVAGRSPFAAASGTDVLAAILEREPAPLARYAPDTPAELQRIVAKALRKDRSQRYESVHDLLLDVQVLRDDLLAQARADSDSTTQAAVQPQASEQSQTAAVFSIIQASWSPRMQSPGAGRQTAECWRTSDFRAVKAVSLSGSSEAKSASWANRSMRCSCPPTGVQTGNFSVPPVQAEMLCWHSGP